MDKMTEHRKSRLLALIKGRPYNGNQTEFADRVKLTKGRISQLLDPEQPFGELAAKNIAGKLRLNARYFEDGFGIEQQAAEEVPEKWPFPGIEPGRFWNLEQSQKDEIQGVVRLQIAGFESPPAPEKLIADIQRLHRSTPKRQIQKERKGSK